MLTFVSDVEASVVADTRSGSTKIVFVVKVSVLLVVVGYILFVDEIAALVVTISTELVTSETMV